MKTKLSASLVLTLLVLTKLENAHLARKAAENAQPMSMSALNAMPDISRKPIAALPAVLPAKIALTKTHALIVRTLTVALVPQTNVPTAMTISTLLLVVFVSNVVKTAMNVPHPPNAPSVSMDGSLTRLDLADFATLIARPAEPRDVKTVKPLSMLTMTPECVPNAVMLLNTVSPVLIAPLVALALMASS